jgi:hypothetical protein
LCGFSQILLYLEEAIILSQSFAAARGTGFNHSGIAGYRQVGNSGIFGLARPVTDNGCPSGLLCSFNDSQGLS